MFSSHKPLYFLFYDRDERYFQDSTLQLPFRTWLWLTLRKSGYSHVCFVDIGSDENPVLTLLDGDSFKAYDFGWHKPAYHGEPIDWKLSEKAQGKLWRAMYGKRGCCAYVFSMRAFSRLGRMQLYYPAEVEQLIKQMSQPDRQDTLILTGSMGMTGDELRDYVDPQGILAYTSPSGQSLCPPAAALLRQEPDTDLFEALKEQLGEQFIELGTLTRGSLLPMLRRLKFQLDQDWDDDTLELYAALLFRWVHVPAARTNCAALFEGLRPPYTCAALYERLREKDAEILCKWADSLRRAAPVSLSAEELLDQQFPFPRDMLKQSHITLEEPRLKELIALPLPWAASGQREDKTFSICPVNEQEWYLMRARLRSPRISPLSEERLRQLNAVLDVLKSARDEGDSRTVGRAARVLLHCGKRLYAEEQTDFDEIKDYLDMSQSYFREERRDPFDSSLEMDRPRLQAQDALFWLPNADAGSLALRGASEEAKRRYLGESLDLIKNFSGASGATGFLF